MHSGSIKSSAMMEAQTHQPPHVCCPPRQMSPLTVTVWPPLDTVVSYGDNVITCPGWTWLVTLHPHHQHQHCSSRYVDILSVAGGHRTTPRTATIRIDNQIKISPNSDHLYRGNGAGHDSEIVHHVCLQVYLVCRNIITIITVITHRLQWAVNHARGCSYTRHAAPGWARCHLTVVMRRPGEGTRHQAPLTPHTIYTLSNTSVN